MIALPHKNFGNANGNPFSHFFVFLMKRRIKMNIKKKLKNLKHELLNEYRTTSAKIMAKDATVLDRGDRITIILTGVFVSFILFASTCFGAADIVDQAQMIISEYYLKLLGITTILAVFCILIAILWIMVSPSDSAASTGIKWIKRILLIWVIANSLGGVAALIDKITQGQRFSG